MKYSDDSIAPSCDLGIITTPCWTPPSPAGHLLDLTVPSGHFLGCWRLLCVVPDVCSWGIQVSSQLRSLLHLIISEELF